VLWSLAIGGLALIIFEQFQKNAQAKTADIESITYKQALCIGLFQSIAIIPGVSRSASTIVGGMLMKISRATIVEFSFLLAVPTMAAATGLDLLKSAGTFHSSDFGLLAIGFVTAFVSAFVAIKFLLKYIQNHTFVPFGIYRIVLAIAFLLFLVY
jgi:undecaprenyl-diphosphatase